MAPGIYGRRDGERRPEWNDSTYRGGPRERSPPGQRDRDRDRDRDSDRDRDRDRWDRDRDRREVDRDRDRDRRDGEVPRRDDRERDSATGRDKEKPTRAQPDTPLSTSSTIFSGPRPDIHQSGPASRPATTRPAAERPGLRLFDYLSNFVYRNIQAEQLKYDLSKRESDTSHISNTHPDHQEFDQLAKSFRLSAEPDVQKACRKAAEEQDKLARSLHDYVTSVVSEMLHGASPTQMRPSRDPAAAAAATAAAAAAGQAKFEEELQSLRQQMAKDRADYEEGLALIRLGIKEEAGKVAKEVTETSFRRAEHSTIEMTIKEAKAVAMVEASAVASAEAKAAVKAEARTIAAAEARIVVKAEAKAIAAAEARTVAAVEARTVATAEARTVAAAEAKTVARVEARAVAGVEARAVAGVEARAVAAAESQEAANKAAKSEQAHAALSREMVPIRLSLGRLVQDSKKQEDDLDRVKQDIRKLGDENPALRSHVKEVDARVDAVVSQLDGMAIITRDLRDLSDQLADLHLRHDCFSNSMMDWRTVDQGSMAQIEKVSQEINDRLSDYSARIEAVEATTMVHTHNFRSFAHDQVDDELLHLQNRQSTLQTALEKLEKTPDHLAALEEKMEKSCADLQENMNGLMSGFGAVLPEIDKIREQFTKQVAQLAGSGPAQQQHASAETIIKPVIDKLESGLEKLRQDIARVRTVGADAWRKQDRKFRHQLDEFQQSMARHRPGDAEGYRDLEGRFSDLLRQLLQDIARVRMCDAEICAILDHNLSPLLESLNQDLAQQRFCDAETETRQAQDGQASQLLLKVEKLEQDIAQVRARGADEYRELREKMDAQLPDGTAATEETMEQQARVQDLEHRLADLRVQFKDRWDGITFQIAHLTQGTSQFDSAEMYREVKDFMMQELAQRPDRFDNKLQNLQSRVGLIEKKLAVGPGGLVGGDEMVSGDDDDEMASSDEVVNGTAVNARLPSADTAESK